MKLRKWLRNERIFRGSRMRWSGHALSCLVSNLAYDTKLVMGCLRTLLALAVVFSHSGYYVFVGGKNAVELFYLISGYLISYVLMNTPAYQSAPHFYFNRVLRLYPVHVVVVVLSLAWMFLFSPSYCDIFHALSLPSKLMSLLINFGIVGQDWTIYYHPARALLPSFVIPQGWTISIELCFYALAPFLLRRPWWMAAVLGLSLGLRLGLMHRGLVGTYRFFPAVLSMFLLGAFAQRILGPIYQRFLKGWERMGTVLMMATTLLFFLIHKPEVYKATALYALMIVLLPLLFMFQNLYVWDRWIGELSYPIYNVHMLVISVVSFTGLRNAVYWNVLGSLCGAYLLNRFVARPVEVWRKR